MSLGEFMKNASLLSILRAGKDANGNAGIVGANGKVIRLPSSGNTLGVIGDSRDDAAFVAPIVNGAATDVYVQSSGSLKWALEIGGQCFSRVGDYSRSGSGMGIVANTASVHPTFPEQMASVLADAPAYCWIRVPVNDLFGGATAAQVFLPFKQLVDTVLAAGIRVELVACTLMDSTKGGLYDFNVQKEIVKLNDLVRAQYGSKGSLGVVFHDTAMVAIQPGSTTYAGVTGAYADHIHFQNVGAYLEGSRIGLNWRSRFPSLPLLGTHASDAYRGAPANNNSLGALLGAGSNQILSNNMFDQGHSGGLANGWAIADSFGCTWTTEIVAAPDWNGNSDGMGQKIVLAPNQANCYVTLQGPNMWGDIQFMKRYIAAVLITVDKNAVNLRNVRMQLKAASATSLTLTHGRLINNDTAIAAMNATGYQGIALCDLDLSVRPDLAPNGSGLERFSLSFIISGGAATNGTASVTFSRAACRLVN